MRIGVSEKKGEERGRGEMGGGGGEENVREIQKCYTFIKRRELGRE